MLDVRKIEKKLNDYSEHHKNFQLINYSEAKTIRDLLIMVISQKIKLPQIQREEVWKDTKKSDFIGTLIVCPEHISNDIIPRITIVTDSTRWMLVDGQQRITSLLRFFKGNPYIAEEIERYSQKYSKNFSLLRIKKSDPPLKLRFSKDCALPKEDKDILSGFSCDKLPIDLQEKLLEVKIIVNVVKVNENAFDDKVRELYLLLNNGIKVNAEETYRGKYAGTVLYDTIDDLAYNYLLPVANYVDRRLKITNLVIDIYSAFIDAYTKGSTSGREKILSKYADNVHAAENFKKEFLAVLDVVKELFPKGKCFSEYKIDGKWKSLSFASALPWAMAIRELLFVDALFTKDDFINNKEHIMEFWKKLTIPTGKKEVVVDIVDNDKWLKYMIDHTNNKDKVLARKEIIKKIIIHAIK